MPTGYEDGTIDWVAFYRGHGVGRMKKSGSKHTGFCPLHDNTRTPAFWFTTENGMWKCEAGCGQGNPTTFLAQKLGVTTKQADAMLCELAGVDKHPARARKAVRPAAPYDVAAYAAEKGLDPALLASWGLSASRGAVLMPYAPGTTDGAVRRRHRPDAEKRFSWALKGGRMQGRLGLYGLFRGFTSPTVVLVEGESDCHALWSMAIEAYGVPGASTFKAEWLPSHVTEVLVHDEGDDGARVFIDRVARECASRGVAVKTWSTPGDAKDPSELFAKDLEEAGPALREAMRAAVPVETAPDGSTPGAGGVLDRWGLTCPQGWVVGAGGVRRFNDETQTSKLVTTTPVVIAGRIVEIATGRERVRLAFLRGGRWHEVTADRAEAFSSRTVVGVLAPLGAQVTSENARDVVRWLGALEQANMDAIEVTESARELGWCKTSFMPTNPGGLLLDLPAGAEDVVAAFTKRGELDTWLAAMGKESNRSMIFRFMLAAGLAPALLKATGGRIFFVYNWGPSRGGKTAAIKAALSAWGDPEVLLTTFNATSVGLERRAALMRDLPLGIDERQAASGDQRRLDEIVYALSSGTGRVRGARDGGLQAQAHWRTIAIATGEEPLSGATSKTGVATRVLEIFGSPFASEESAAEMHRLSGECYGHAGPLFIEKVIEAGDDAVRQTYGEVRDLIAPYGQSHALSHLDGIATVLTADVLSGMWLFGLKRADALRSSVELGVAVVGMIEVAASGDVDETACLWVEDWLRSRVGQFSDNGFHGPLLGEKRGSSWLVFPSPFREAIEAAGFSYRKTMRALEERGALKTAGGQYTTSQRIYGERKRVLWIEETGLGGELDHTLPGLETEGAPF